MQKEEEIRKLLRGARTIAVVGLSDRPERSSFGVTQYLQSRGYRIIPVNPKLQHEVFGETPYASLQDIPVPVDIVDVFRRSELVPPVVDEAIAIGAKAVWMQLGVEHHAAAERARQAGLQVVMNRCIAVDHRLLLGD
jgi:predicted CoA-binding protein